MSAEVQQHGKIYNNRNKQLRRMIVEKGTSSLFCLWTLLEFCGQDKSESK